MFWKVLAVTLAVIWFTGLIIRSVFSSWLRKRTEEFNRAARQAQKEAQRQARRKSEGDVTVEGSETGATKKVNRSVGEYVEFEEITTVTEEGGNAKR